MVTDYLFDRKQPRRQDLRRLLLVGNSMSQSPMQGVEAYPELLETRLDAQWRVVKIIKGGQTVDQFESEIVTALDEIVPRAVILQVGVNECGPRPLKRRERERLGKVRPAWLRSLLIRAIHEFRPQIIRARGPNQFTSLPVFTESVRRIVKKAVSLHCPVLILPIMHVSRIAEVRQPFFNREIDRYNEILRSMKDRAVVYVEEPELFMNKKAEDLCVSPESVHLNAWAHERLTEFVADWVDALFANRRVTPEGR